MTNNEKAGLFSANMPLHADFVKLLVECSTDSEKLKISLNHLEAIHTNISAQIDRVVVQQKQVLEDQTQMVKTLLNGLTYPENDPTFEFCKGYINSLAKKENTQEGD